MAGRGGGGRRWIAGGLANHPVAPPRPVSSPGVESLADRPADVTGASTAVAQYLRRAGHQGGADAASFHMGRDPDAADGGGGRPEHRQEDGVRAGAIKQQGGDDRSPAVPGDQDVLVADPEPATPAPHP